MPSPSRVACLVAAVASALRGGKYHAADEEETTLERAFEGEAQAPRVLAGAGGPE